ncbi:RdRP-domain-containing protein [Polyporus arcularius HHB13444]|uniref:RNA-dependent RNA polymerase n=1 Tax=Polyporus arcularius HHB13444 TaxID=1314778 RepID=A0A5C3PQI0_9APHY|nr:RdRP-domain-containing protein [Polyporus arcularius HHB13444]
MLNKKTYWIPLLRPGIETTIPTTRVMLNARPADFVDFQEMADCRAFRLCGRPESRFILVAAGENMGENLFRLSLKQWIARGYAYRNRRYSFLGFTDTQAMSRKPKLMFFAEGPDWTVKSLLASFGDLQLVYETDGYGKYAARLHLAFSGNVPSLDVPDELIVEIPDNRAPDGSLHTDGIGMIRDSFAAEVCEFNGIPSDTSAFQIRRGGIKGILVRYSDAVFDSLVGLGGGGRCNIAYRSSMIKFAGGPTELELVNFSEAPRMTHLNIQLILLLTTLGVPLNVFERMLDKQLQAMADIPTDRARALQCIRRSYRPDPSDPDSDLEEDGPANWGQRLTSMLMAPQDLAEPYLRTELLKFQKWQYSSLAKKLQLQVQEAGYVIGVVDELGVLEEGEVFLKLPHLKSEYITGQVAITRMPCFSTGDIRKFTAVVRPELDHIENCVVFSRKSSRSVPDMIASGDLDGDLYMVIWDQALIPPTQKPALPRLPAISQSPTDDKKYPLENMMTDAIETFVAYRGQGVLVGKLHGLWIEAAQATRALAGSPLAQELVNLNEKALDMVKNGVKPKDIEDELDRLSKRHATIRNPALRNPIAVLRNQVLTEQARIEAMQKRLNIVFPTKPWTPHPSLDLEHEDRALFAQYFLQARNLLRDYNRRLRRAIERDEKNASTRERGDVKHADILKQSFVDQYFGGTTASEYAQERMRASAWYCYAYGECKVDFAWLGARYLNAICAGK